MGDRTSKYGAEDAPELADLYLSYGKALLENAISQASVLGKDGDGAADQEGVCNS
jgi:HAT1-interacting factor 1